jgi:hypothetical protein
MDAGTLFLTVRCNRLLDDMSLDSQTETAHN